MSVEDNNVEEFHVYVADIALEAGGFCRRILVRGSGRGYLQSWQPCEMSWRQDAGLPNHQGKFAYFKLISEVPQMMQAPEHMHAPRRDMSGVSKAQIHVGAHIRSRREERGMSLEELARLTSLGSNVLGRIEAGEERAPAEVLFSIATALEVSMSYFFEGAPS